MQQGSAPKISFVSLGCPKALVDSERIITRLRAEGYELARKHDGADVVIVNTCGFLDSAKQESLSAIGSAMAENGKVIVTGCMGAEPEQIEQAYPGDISSGMKRRVEIIRALISPPKILLMDEPFRALDALTKSVMHEFLLRLYDAEPCTIFFITHDLLEAIYLADVVSVMTTRPGRIKKIVRINVPRPRSHKVFSSAYFLHLKDDITAEVHSEAVKAFEVGER